MTESVLNIGTVVIYFFGWLFLFFDNLLPLGRPAVALLFSSLITLWNAWAQKDNDGDNEWIEAFHYVDLGTLALLFGMMILEKYLQQTSALKYFTSWLYAGRSGWKISFIRICIFTGFMSAIFTNDVLCYFVTPIVLSMLESKPRAKTTSSAHPIVISIAGKLLLSVDLLKHKPAFANLGSQLTIIGNPQNSLISRLGQISFVDHLKVMCVPTLLLLSLHLIYLLVWYRNLIKSPDHYDGSGRPLLQRGESMFTGGEDDWIEPPLEEYSTNIDSVVSSQRAEESFQHHRSPHREMRSKHSSISESLNNDSSFFDPNRSDFGTGSQVFSSHSDDLVDLNRNAPAREKYQKFLTYCLAIAVVLMLVELGLKQNVGWSALVAAALMLTASAVYKKMFHHSAELVTESNAILHQVDYTVLVMFGGLFVLVGTVVETNIPLHAWKATLGHVDEEKLLSLPWLLVFGITVSLLSNLLSNVPVIVMLQPIINGFTRSKYAWLQVSWCCTISGNLTIFGSAANFIVAERVFGSIFPDYFTGWKHLKVSFLPTLVHIVLGNMHTYMQNFSLKLRHRDGYYSCLLWLAWNEINAHLSEYILNVDKTAIY